MATATLVLELKLTDRAAADVAQWLCPGVPDAAHSHRIMTNVAKLISAVTGGAGRRGNAWVSVYDDTGAVAAGVITPTYANTANGWVEWRFGTTATVRLTEGVDFLRGANVAATTAALAQAINDNVLLSGLVRATATALVVNLVATAPEPVGSQVVMATNAPTGYAFTQLTGGTLGVAKFPLTFLPLGPNP